MAPPYIYTKLDVPSLYLSDKKKGLNSNLKPKAECFWAGLVKARAVLNDKPERTPRTRILTSLSAPETKSKPVQTFEKPKQTHTSAPQHSTVAIEDSRLGAVKDEMIEKRVQEKQLRMKTTSISSHSLDRDKQFLELIQSTNRSKTKVGKRVQSLTQEALEYLDTRSNYWSQQIPDHVRRSSRTISATPGLEEDDWIKCSPQQATKEIQKQLNKIDKMMSNGQYNQAIITATALMSDVKRMEKRVAGKESVLANCCSILGNAHLEMGDNTKAIAYHREDLRYGTEFNIQMSKSRALDNLGRVYARIGKFQRAIQVWTEKLNTEENIAVQERSWLHHEVGYCHLKLGHYSKARASGSNSYKCATEAKHQTHQLNAYILITQAILSADNLFDCKSSLEKALKQAVSTDTRESPNKISDALSNLRKAVKSFKTKEQELKIGQRSMTFTSLKASKKESKNKLRIMEKEERVIAENGGEHNTDRHTYLSTTRTETLHCCQTVR